MGHFSHCVQSDIHAKTLRSPGAKSARLEDQMQNPTCCNASVALPEDSLFQLVAFA